MRSARGPERRVGSGVDDATPADVKHRGGCVAQIEPGAYDVYAQEVLERGLLVFVDRRNRALDDCIVEQNVQPAELAEDALDVAATSSAALT
jgi:hypothetical protein